VKDAILWAVADWANNANPIMNADMNFAIQISFTVSRPQTMNLPCG
jgi:hypothetical protein